MPCITEISDTRNNEILAFAEKAVISLREMYHGAKLPQFLEVSLRNACINTASEFYKRGYEDGIEAKANSVRLRLGL